MKMTFTRDEVSKMLSLLEWINIATMDTDEAKQQVVEIAMKLKVALKNTEDEDFEFLVER